MHSLVPTPEEQRQLDAFYEEIRYLDHLIIDLRLNVGVMPNWFNTAFLVPNIERRFAIDGFVFIAYGDYSAEYANIRHGTLIDSGSGISSIDAQRRPVAEILESYDLPDLNLADMERMDYGFRVQTVISPDQRSSGPVFPGKIWLLTGPYMRWAAQISAWTAKESGFVTLVGEVTGGIVSGPRTFVALPNSGIVFQMGLYYVTDSRGRPLEAGIAPHIFNREGMDALETVLALIAEGAY